MSCVYCSVSQGVGNIAPSDAAVKQLFDGPLCSLKNAVLHVFAETEPTLNEGAIEYLRTICTKRNLKPLITTNGSNPEYVLQLAREGWVVTVSHDGLEQNSNRKSDEKPIVLINGLKKLNDPFLVRSTIRNWNTFHETVHFFNELDIRYLEVSLILALGLGNHIEPTCGSAWRLVFEAIANPHMYIFTPISGRGFCPLAANGGNYWVFNGAKWRSTCCFVDTSLTANRATREETRKHGCLIHSIDNEWKQISQHEVLLKGRAAWQKVLGVPAHAGGGCCV